MTQAQTQLLAGFQEAVTHAQPQLLDLPQEILLMIFQYLPSRSLVACSMAHSMLRNTILQHSFIDKHFKITLGLLSEKDGNIGCIIRRANLPLSMHLWFITHNAATSLASNSQNYNALLTRDSIFYPLEFFHHSLFTWLSQALSTKTGIFETPENLRKTHRVVCDYQEADLFKDVYKLPKFVLQPLTKLAVLFPDIILKTILASHCSLHKGKPVNLQNVWYEGLTTDQRTHFEHQYCMEILCDRPKGAFAKMSAMLILFTNSQCIIWTGIVACFPGCKFEETLAITVFNTTSGVEATRTDCFSALLTFLSDTSIEEITNCEWKKQKLYPGLCYLIHQSQRADFISNLLDTAKRLSQILSYLIHVDENVNLKIFTFEQNDRFKPTKFNQFRDALLIMSNQRDSHSQTEDIYSSILQKLDSMFRQEILEYLSDAASHELICPSCSKKWFISKSVIADCVYRVMSNIRVPFDMWPYHCIMTALIISQESLTKLRKYSTLIES